MNSPPKVLVKSASLILAHPQNPDKLLMLKRGQSISFGGMTAFPGGAVDKEDREDLPNSFEVYGKITALRELLEETGILLVPGKTKPDDIKKMRDEMHQTLKKTQSGIQHSQSQFNIHFGAALRGIWSKHLHLIHPIVRLLTIQSVPTKRFDCIFYVLDPSVSSVNMSKLYSHDNLDQLSLSSQSVSYQWGSIQDFQTQHIKRQILLPPPQLIILEALKRHNFVRRGFPTGVPFRIEPIIMHMLNPRLFALFGDREFPFESVLQNEPDSESKHELRQLFLSRNPQITERRLVVNKDASLQFSSSSNEKEETLFSLLANHTNRPNL